MVFTCNRESSQAIISDRDSSIVITHHHKSSRAIISHHGSSLVVTSNREPWRVITGHDYSSLVSSSCHYNRTFDVRCHENGKTLRKITISCLYSLFRSKYGRHLHPKRKKIAQSWLDMSSHYCALSMDVECHHNEINSRGNYLSSIVIMTIDVWTARGAKTKKLFTQSSLLVITVDAWTSCASETKRSFHAVAICH